MKSIPPPVLIERIPTRMLKREPIAELPLWSAKTQGPSVIPRRDNYKTTGGLQMPDSGLKHLLTDAARNYVEDIDDEYCVCAPSVST